jgi:uncharacterized ion transporter superfamily protein YfcC
MPREPEAIRITTATRSRNEDIALRQKRYLISMSIRTVCFVLGVVSLGHWFMWVFLAASFVLPTIAVVVANSSSPPDPGGPDYFEPDFGTRAVSGPPSTS